MSETTQTTKNKTWNNFLIKKDRIEKELDKSYVINYDEENNFIFPKKLTYLKNEILNESDNLESANYIALSFPIEGDFKRVTIKEKKGILDENTKNWIHKSKEVLLTDLKEHFKNETNEIYQTVKELKDKEEGN